MEIPCKNSRKTGPLRGTSQFLGANRPSPFRAASVHPPATHPGDTVRKEGYASTRSSEPSAWWRDDPDRRWPVTRANPWSDPYDDEEEPDRFDASMPSDHPEPARWYRALAAGLEAAAWWLRRTVGKPSLVAALAIGLIFAGLAWLVGPHLAGSALALAALAGFIRLASLALSQTTP